MAHGSCVEQRTDGDTLSRCLVTWTEVGGRHVRTQEERLPGTFIHVKSPIRSSPTGSDKKYATVNMLINRKVSMNLLLLYFDKNLDGTDTTQKTPTPDRIQRVGVGGTISSRVTGGRPYP